MTFRTHYTAAVAANITTIALLFVIVTQLTVQVERRIGLGWAQANYRVTS
jgi:hypothetical protein